MQRASSKGPKTDVTVQVDAGSNGGGGGRRKRGGRKHKNKGSYSGASAPLPRSSRSRTPSRTSKEVPRRSSSRGAASVDDRARGRSRVAAPRRDDPYVPPVFPKYQRNPSAGSGMQGRSGGGIQLRSQEGVNAILRDSNVTPGTRVVTVISNLFSVTGPLNYLISLLVAKYDSMAPGRMGIILNPGDGAYEPVQFMGALYIVAWAYLKKIGLFSNSALTAALPDVEDDTPVPIPLAKLIQYFAPFVDKSTGAQFECTEATAALPTLTTTNGQVTAAGTNLFERGLVTIYPTSQTTDELSGTTGAAITALSDVTPYVQIMMSAMSEVFGCVRFRDIPTVAPDASIHAAINVTNFRVVNTTPHFDPEVSVMLAPTAFSGITVWGSYDKPHPTLAAGAMSARGGISTSATNVPLFVGWMETLLRCPWGPGPVKALMAKCDMGKVTSVLPELFDMDMRQWHNLAAATVLQRYNDNGQAMTGIQATLLLLSMEFALIARFGEWTYLTHPTFTCRAYDSAFRSMNLPAWVSIFLWACGPVIHNGRLRLVLPYNTSTTVNHWSNTVTAATPLAQVATGSSGYCQGWFQGSQAQTAFTLNGMNLTALIVSSNFAITPVRTSALFVENWNVTMGYTGANLTRGLDADLNKSFGAKPNLCVVTFGTVPSNSYQGQVVTTGLVQTLIRYNNPISFAGFDVPHSRTDAALSLFCGLIAAPTTLTTQPTRYFCNTLLIGNLQNLTPMLVASEQSADFNGVLSEARGKIAKFYSIKGQSMDYSLQGNFLMSALAGVAGPILANALPQVANWAIDKVSGVNGQIALPKELGNTYFSDFGDVAKLAPRALEVLGPVLAKKMAS